MNFVNSFQHQRAVYVNNRNLYKFRLPHGLDMTNCILVPTIQERAKIKKTDGKHKETPFIGHVWKTNPVQSFTTTSTSSFLKDWSLNRFPLFVFWRGSYHSHVLPTTQISLTSFQFKMEKGKKWLLFGSMDCFIEQSWSQTAWNQSVSSPCSTQLGRQNINWLLLIGWFEWTFVRFPTCPRSRNEKSWNGPEKWFQDDFRLVNLFLRIPGSWEPVYLAKNEETSRDQYSKKSAVTTRDAMFRFCSVCFALSETNAFGQAATGPWISSTSLPSPTNVRHARNFSSGFEGIHNCYRTQSLQSSRHWTKYKCIFESVTSTAVVCIFRRQIWTEQIWYVWWGISRFSCHVCVDITQKTVRIVPTVWGHERLSWTVLY